MELKHVQTSCHDYQVVSNRFLELISEKNKNPMHDLFLCTASKKRLVTVAPGGLRGAPLPGNFRVIVCPTIPQMNDVCDLLGTPDAPVSKILSVK